MPLKNLDLGSSHVVRANSRDLPLPDDSVDLIVTSPPYFALRSYQDGGEHYQGQIGDEPTPAEFVASLIEVTRECMRVLKPSGSIWVNLGDKYAGSGMGGNTSLANSTSYKDQRAKGYHPECNTAAPDTTTDQASSATESAGVRGALSKEIGIRSKSLMGIPWRYALACIDDLGLILRAEVIWSKPNGLPESVTDRVRRSHEQWFHFTLNPRYYSAVDNIREAHIGGGHKGLETRHERSGGVLAATRSNVDGNPLGKLPGSVWTIPTQPLRVPDHLGIDHFAAFPMEFPRRIIQGWSPRGVCTACGEGRRPITTKEGTGVEQHGNNPDPKRKLVKGFNTITLGDPRRNVSDAREVVRGVLTTITGEACACPDTTAPTTPGVVLDPFGGTGTTALLAKALGRHGITVDMSADYCRLAQWRTTDPDQLAQAMQVEKPAVQIEGQWDLFDTDPGESVSSNPSGPGGRLRSCH